MIPVFVPEGEDAEAILDGSAFEPVWSVVRALRDHDKKLADQLDAARRKKGREGKITSDDLPPKVVFDLPDAVVGDAFIDAIVTRIVERATSPWEAGFAEVEQYAAVHGDERVPKAFKTEAGYRLGQWVGVQRRTRSTLRLDTLGFVWDARPGKPSR